MVEDIREVLKSQLPEGCRGEFETAEAWNDGNPDTAGAYSCQFSCEGCYKFLGMVQNETEAPGWLLKWFFPNRESIVPPIEMCWEVKHNRNKQQAKAVHGVFEAV
ncbi:MAG: hypothetical protein AAB909_04890 [Patescibacteria group bacterium]